MRAPLRFPLRALLAIALPVVIAACAPAPIYKADTSAFVTATPQQVATSPQNFHGLQVVWGGSVVSVHNFPHHSEIEILAYPLDSSQRPRMNQPTIGRFIATVPGFVEPMNYPPGSLVTLRGTLDGARNGTVGQADYTFALVHSDAMHRWTPEEMRPGHPNINFGVGLGVGIR
ncbi:MAG: Slp family lipoprotein [Rhodanobacteraceae bacterium]|nr:MAG: Slp family lipoprotein [Rhodanobacteraceae bacterium]